MFEDTKGVVRGRTLMDNRMAKRKGIKGQTMIYKTPHWKLKNEQHDSHLQPGVNSGAPKG